MRFCANRKRPRRCARFYRSGRPCVEVSIGARGQTTSDRGQATSNRERHIQPRRPHDQCHRRSRGRGVDGHITAPGQSQRCFQYRRPQPGALILADDDPDPLLVVDRIADDYPPKPPQNVRRKITEAETVTLCLARRSSEPVDPRLTAGRGKRLSHLFPTIPTRDAIHKPRSGCPARSRRRSRTTRASQPSVSSTSCCSSIASPSSALPPPRRRSTAAVPPSLADALTDTSRTKPPIPIEDKNLRGK